MIRLKIAKALMRIKEIHPKFHPKGRMAMTEVFNHEHFLNADSITQNEIMNNISLFRYKDEMKYPLDNYFDTDLSKLLRGNSALDLGCFTGGRSVAWFERYNLDKIHGIDVRDVFIQAAKQFADSKSVNAEYKVSKGENLPYEDSKFDAILSFDVFEHLVSVKKTLSECHRVLKKGGKLVLVFPSYYHPFEHHLGLVTRTPCIHWFFSGRLLTKAYYEIINSRGKNDQWYNRKTPYLEEWERSNILNGVTYRKFKSLLDPGDWRVISEAHKPVGAIGRNVEGKKGLQLISKLFVPLTYIPYLQEFTLHRVSYILEKRRE